MQKSKRKFRRYELPLAVKFRPTYGAKTYAEGVITNLTGEGLGLDAPDFKFILYENLELLFDIPRHFIPLTLSGDVVWKKQDGKRCRAGISLRMKDRAMQKEYLEKLVSSSDVPLSVLSASDTEHTVNHRSEKRALPAPDLPGKLGFIKRYLEGGARCRVTFRLERETAGASQDVFLVGDFNNWDPSQAPMKRLDNGDFVITLDLDSRREYRFRYLVDGRRWENDWYADRYVRNDHGSKDSVVVV